jgi:hypothetical protein
MAIATCIFNNFATSGDLENLVVTNAESDESKIVINIEYIEFNFSFSLFFHFKVSFAMNYPDVKIPLNLKRHVESMVKNPKQTTSMMYKALISGIFSYLEYKAIGNFNPSTLINAFGRNIEACKGDWLNNFHNIFFLFALNLFLSVKISCIR